MQSDRPKRSKMDIFIGWLFVAAVAYMCALQFGCNTVAGLGSDITAAANGIRAEMSKD